MPVVLDSLASTPDATEYLRVSQLEPGDEKYAAPEIAYVQRAAWGQRYVKELGLALPEYIDAAFSDKAVADQMADMGTLRNQVQYMVSDTEDGLAGKVSVNGAVSYGRYDPGDKRKQPHPYIHGIDVHPAAGQRGIGSVLLDRALAQFPEDRAVALYAHPDNRATVAWYGRLGFVARQLVTSVHLGVTYLQQYYYEAPSVAIVRAALLPALVRHGYTPAVVNATKVAQNA